MTHERKSWHFWLLFGILLAGGAFVHWREASGETAPPKKMLVELPEKLGGWQKLGADGRFDAGVESMLKTDDYLMRDYYLPATNRAANIYVGYHGSQRTGATYHSPRNCLPGSGWTMTAPALTEIKLPDGRTFTANRYIIENQTEKSLMLYWYQGRGRFTANEYENKLLTVWDSITRRRSDGAFVRVVVFYDDADAKVVAAASDVAAELAANLAEFVPN